MSPVSFPSQQPGWLCHRRQQLWAGGAQLPLWLRKIECRHRTPRILGAPAGKGLFLHTLIRLLCLQRSPAPSPQKGKEIHTAAQRRPLCHPHTQPLSVSCWALHTRSPAFPSSHPLGDCGWSLGPGAGSTCTSKSPTIGEPPGPPGGGRAGRCVQGDRKTRGNHPTPASCVREDILCERPRLVTTPIEPSLCRLLPELCLCPYGQRPDSLSRARAPHPTTLNVPGQLDGVPQPAHLP